MKKIVLVLGLVLGIAVFANSTEAQAKVLTKHEAAKKIATASKKAYKSKKNVTVSFKIKKSAIEAKNFNKLIAKAEWGSYAIGGYAVSKVETPGVNNCDYTVPSVEEFPDYAVNWKYKNGVYTVKEKIYYSTVKSMYSNFPYWKKICKKLKSATKNMSQVEKAAYVDSWLGARLGYHLASEEGKSNIYYFATPKRIWKGTAFGQCEVRADIYAVFAKIVGVKHVATVHIPEIHHLSSAVRFEDGRIFVFDLGDTYEFGFREEYAGSATGEEQARETFELIFENGDQNPENSFDDPHKLQITWYQENKSETFTGKQQQKVNGLIYSKYAW